MKPLRPVSSRFKRNSSGLFYLILVGLSAAFAANVFREDEGVLRIPVFLVVLCFVCGLLIRRFARSR